MKVLIYRTPMKQDIPVKISLTGQFEQVPPKCDHAGGMVSGESKNTPYKLGSNVPECGKVLVPDGDYNGYPFWQ